MTPFEKLFGFDPKSGYCIFCTKKLIPEVDSDFAVCNDCWTKTFACKICGDENGDCGHEDVFNIADIEDPEEPPIGTYYVE